jgi:UDP-N-acetylmuramyl tripeptide synthase
MSDSIFNVYNQVSVIALFREMGMSLGDIREKMNAMKIVESRYDEETIGDVRLISQLGKEKNAYATSRAFDYVTQKPGQKEIIMMLAGYTEDSGAEGQTISWIYDCDFEFLNKPDITRIVCSGIIADDFKLRLLLAGVPEEKIICVRDVEEAPKLLEYNKGEIVYLIHGGDPMEPVFKVYDIIKKTAREKAEEAGK